MQFPLCFVHSKNNKIKKRRRIISVNKRNWSPDLSKPLVKDHA
jgi:hypothetical protein